MGTIMTLCGSAGDHRPAGRGSVERWGGGELPDLSVSSVTSSVTGFTAAGSRDRLREPDDPRRLGDAGRLCRLRTVDDRAFQACLPEMRSRGLVIDSLDRAEMEKPARRTGAGRRLATVREMLSRQGLPGGLGRNVDEVLGRRVPQPQADGVDQAKQC